MNKKSIMHKLIVLILIVIFAPSTCFGATTVKIVNYNTVPTLTVGQSFTIYGTIKSNKTITRVEVGVVNSSNKWVTKYDKKVNSKSFSISKADPYVKFGSLKAGTYKYRIYAHVSKKTYTVLNQKFTVKSKPSPTPTHMKTVKEQQVFLNKVNVGTIQGKIAEDAVRGEQTIKAIKLFQQIEGLEVDGVWGKATNNASNKSIAVNGKRKAMNWACSVANDNSFAYGTGQRAHRSGCYFCKTNTGDRKWKKEKKGEPHYVKDKNGKKHTYTKTYCCNPFITAAYAHGAQDKALYKICHAGTSCGMSTSDWKKSPYFKTVGASKNVGYSQLKAGDIIIATGWCEHVWMYIGHGRYVEASGGTWSASSIAVKGNAKSNYATYHKHNNCWVMRYSK